MVSPVQHPITIVQVGQRHCPVCKTVLWKNVEQLLVSPEKAKPRRIPKTENIHTRCDVSVTLLFTAVVNNCSGELF